MTAMSAKIAQLEGRLQAAESDLGLLRQTVHDLLLENRQLALGVDPRRLGSLADAEPGPAAATAGRSRADPPRDLLSFLELLRLGHFCERIHNLGAESVADLVDVEDPDLVALGFSQLERNRFFRAVRAQGLLSERGCVRAAAQEDGRCDEVGTLPPVTPLAELPSDATDALVERRQRRSLVARNTLRTGACWRRR